MAPPKRRRSLTAYAALSLLSLLTFAIAIEVASLGYFAATQGGLFYTRDKTAAKVNRRDILDMVFHPYFGYVYRYKDDPFTVPNWSRLPLRTNNDGFVFPVVPNRAAMPDYPYEPKSDEVVVAILGGSVALHFFEYNYRTDHLGEMVARLPRFAGKKIVLLNLAMAGYRQPQQLMILAYYLSLGQRIDVAISIDGFNEILHSAVNWARGAPFNHPMEDAWGNLGRYVEQVSLSLKTGYGAKAQWHEWASTSARDKAEACGLAACHALFKVIESHHSRTAASIWQSHPDELQSESYFRTKRDHMAAPANWPNRKASDKLLEQAANVWMDSGIAAAALARRFGAEFIDVIQPNRHYEASRAFPPIDPDYPTRFHWLIDPVRRGYANLTSRIDKMRESGVQIFDATSAFDHLEKSPYKDDCCHYEEDGNRVLTNFIFTRIAESMEGSAPVRGGDGN